MKAAAAVLLQHGDECWRLKLGKQSHIFITRSFTEGHLHCLYFLATINRDAMNMAEQLSVDRMLNSL